MLKRKNVLVLMTIPLAILGGAVIKVTFDKSGLNVVIDNPLYEDSDDDVIQTTTLAIGEKSTEPKTEQETNPETSVENSSVVLETTTSTSTTTTQTTELSIESTTYTADITDITADYNWQDVTQEQETQTQEISNEIQQTEDTICINESTEETVSSQINILPSDYSEDYIEDAIIIKDKCIPIAYGPADQINVDMSDVVQDTDFFSSDKVTYFFGHNTRSFKILRTVGLGETTDNSTDIKLFDSGEYVIKRKYDKNSIFLITCYSVLQPNHRRVIIASVE